MTALPAIFNRYDKKTLLIGLAGLLLLVNLGRLGLSSFSAWQEDIENQIVLLAKYKKATARLAALKRNIARLERQDKELEAYLFTGASEEEIASAMQIRLQEQVVKAGLEPEFIQPTRRGAGLGRAAPGEGIAIKLRMAGTLNNFAAFLRNLYRSDKLFTIESLTVKPYKKTDIKIFMEVKGYYALTK